MTRRCPQHPHGCTKHPNPRPPRTLTVEARHALACAMGQARRRGSLERYLAIQLAPGRRGRAIIPRPRKDTPQ
jgi:hypothetical protein